MKRLISIILALALTITLTACKKPGEEKQEPDYDSAKLIVHFIDVGQGDSILLESDDEFVLIDAGERESGETVRDYILERGADELKYVIATHPHSDHIGGMRTVLNDISADNFITYETDCETYTWTKLLDAVDKQDINYIDAVPGDTYDFGKAQFTILAPLKTYSGYNSCSVVVKVTCGDISFLLTGDAEKDSEYDMVSSGEDLSADVLKCGHHGSSTSTTAKFLKAVDPSYAVISCGTDNEYGHPHKETLRKLELLGCDVFRTDEIGTIVAYTDGKELHFYAADSDLSSYTYSADEQDDDDSSLYYIGNKNSHVFHYTDCSGVASMNENNKVQFDTREEAVNAGYKPCSTCNP